MNYYGLVYCATNIVNNKKYIGQTTRSLKKRKQEHLRKRETSTQYFYNSLNKYGPSSFYWYIVEYAISKEDLEAERQLNIDNISLCLTNPRRTSGNCHWTFQNDSITLEEQKARLEKEINN